MILENRQSGTVSILQAIFARSDWLKASMSRKPNPPMLFGFVSVSQETQQILFSPAFGSHQNLIESGLTSLWTSDAFCRQWRRRDIFSVCQNAQGDLAGVFQEKEIEDLSTFIFCPDADSYFWRMSTREEQLWLSELVKNMVSLANKRAPPRPRHK